MKFGFAAPEAPKTIRGTSGHPRHTKLTRYRCSLPGLAGFAGNRCTEPEVPPIGRIFSRRRESSIRLEVVKVFAGAEPQSPASSFRGVCDEESLSREIEERFLTSFGMTLRSE